MPTMFVPFRWIAPEETRIDLGQKPHDRVGRNRLARSGLSNDAEDLTAFQIEGDILDGMGPLHPFRQAHGQVAHRERHIFGVYSLEAEAI